MSERTFDQLDHLLPGEELMRQFDTGATRDTDEGKLKYEGFLNPYVLRRYAEYMHKHRVQSDGSLRDPDNWQKGIPVEAYQDSLIRHIIDVWLKWRTPGHLTLQDWDEYEELLCAILFNTMGLLFESVKPPNPYE